MNWKDKSKLNPRHLRNHQVGEKKKNKKLDTGEGHLVRVRQGSDQCSVVAGGYNHGRRRTNPGRGRKGKGRGCSPWGQDLRGTRERDCESHLSMCSVRTWLKERSSKQLHRLCWKTQDEIKHGDRRPRRPGQWAVHTLSNRTVLEMVTFQDSSIPPSLSPSLPQNTYPCHKAAHTHTQ